MTIFSSGRTTRRLARSIFDHTFSASELVLYRRRIKSHFDGTTRRLVAQSRALLFGESSKPGANRYDCPERSSSSRDDDSHCEKRTGKSPLEEISSLPLANTCDSEQQKSTLAHQSQIPRSLDDPCARDCQLGSSSISDGSFAKKSTPPIPPCSRVEEYKRKERFWQWLTLLVGLPAVVIATIVVQTGPKQPRRKSVPVD